jgi:hypothetical protein
LLLGAGAGANADADRTACVCNFAIALPPLTSSTFARAGPL